jgi:hypothetical protein
LLCTTNGRERLGHLPIKRAARAQKSQKCRLDLEQAANAAGFSAVSPGEFSGT